MEILYKVHNNLYVNMTNKCPFACTFCLRQTMDRIGESDRLWLEREPDVNEVIAEFDKWNMEDFGEVVFCGFGEPTEVWDKIREVALPPASPSSWASCRQPRRTQRAPSCQR